MRITQGDSYRYENGFSSSLYCLSISHPAGGVASRTVL